MLIRIDGYNFTGPNMLSSAEIFKALADETRLRIINLLVRGELCVCEIMKVLDIGQSKASRHLGVLRYAGLVSDRRQGLWMYYSLAQPDGVMHQRVVEWLAEADDEIPHGAADLKALDELRKLGQLCGPLCARERKAAPQVAATATS